MSPGTQPCSVAEGASFDLTILDMEIPAMDGFGLVEKLRALSRAWDIPLMLLAAPGRDAAVARGLTDRGRPPAAGYDCDVSRKRMAEAAAR